MPENVAARVRTAVAERLPLVADDLLFNASHTHSGPGAFAPGWVGRQFAGAYDPAVETFLVEAITAAIVQAHAGRRPARLGGGKIAVPENVRNRARPGAAVDSDLHFLVLERDDGSRAVTVSYSAHPTLIRADNMTWSAGYPGSLTRTLERGGADLALFLAGAVGSMEPVSPAESEGFAAAEALGQALAARLVPELDRVELRPRVEVASAGIAFSMPPLQVRWNRSLRFSPFLVRALGVDNGAWLGGVRVGETVLIGTPSDFSGEISAGLKSWAKGEGWDLWVLSFNGDYVGYVSPDRYYPTASREGREGYETYLMSWCGPQQEEYLVRLIRRMLAELSSQGVGGVT